MKLARFSLIWPIVNENLDHLYLSVLSCLTTFCSADLDLSLMWISICVWRNFLQVTSPRFLYILYYSIAPNWLMHSQIDRISPKKFTCYHPSLSFKDLDEIQLGLQHFWNEENCELSSYPGHATVLPTTLRRNFAAHDVTSECYTELQSTAWFNVCYTYNNTLWQGSSYFLKLFLVTRSHVKAHHVWFTNSQSHD